MMHDQIDFTDDTVVVTGAARGIGRGVAEAFADHGAHVVVADIDEDGGTDTVAEITDDYAGTAEFRFTDVSDYASCGETVEATVDERGGLDVCINVAAGGLDSASDLNQPFIEERPADWEPQFQVTLRGPMNMSHHAVRAMRDDGGGAVVNFASDSYQGQDPNLAAYATAKAGIVAFTKTVAKELGQYDIRMNCVSPGTTWTPSTESWLEEYGDRVADSYPLGRLGQPEDHANATLFLASDTADWVTGQVLSVNGGFL